MKVRLHSNESALKVFHIEQRNEHQSQEMDTSDIRRAIRKLDQESCEELLMAIASRLDEHRNAYWPQSCRAIALEAAIKCIEEATETLNPSGDIVNPFAEIGDRLRQGGKRRLPGGDMKQSTYIVTARVFGVTDALRFCMLLDHPATASVRLAKRFGPRLVSCDSVFLESPAHSCRRGSPC